MHAFFLNPRPNVSGSMDESDDDAVQEYAATMESDEQSSDDGDDDAIGAIDMSELCNMHVGR